MKTTKSVSKLRREYNLNKLTEETVHKNPYRQFEKWFNQVLKLHLKEPNAMVLATADGSAKPSARIVLMKGIDKKGILFFTNYDSRKGKELFNNPGASLLFFWAELERQVRIEGKVKKISKSESQKYFDSRPLESRIAAWASNQSGKIPSRKYLEDRYNVYKEKFLRKKIPVPDNWGGYILVPDYFEFWQGRESRLHDRISYKKNKGVWKISRLAP